jgi:hypothetical protein
MLVSEGFDKLLYLNKSMFWRRGTACRARGIINKERINGHGMPCPYGIFQREGETIEHNMIVGQWYH